MAQLIWVEWMALAGICLLSSGLAAWLITARPASARAGPLSTRARGAVFLFDGDDMIDGSDPSKRYLGPEERDISWQQVSARLSRTYPDFPCDPEFVRRSGRLFVPDPDGGPACGALCEWVDGITRVELRTGDPDMAELDPGVAGRELAFLRDTLDTAPYPIWRTGKGGTVTWANSAYKALARKVRGAGACDLENLFPDMAEERKPGRKSRVSIAADDQGNRLWFDLTVVEQSEGSLFYAVDINAVVDAEVAQRNFVQTLAKTFAQLNIGLAIFDRDRQLALFNPALIDLTDLPADFLSARPNLFTFFDRLRDRRMMPEPKNYSSWRHQMSDLVAAATDGRYQETWSLPSGSVYSVSGRPHPDGAVAFLFEDITAEITLTRRFRSELELGQSVLDHLEDAIAVFAPDGTLAFSNSAYATLWDTDPDRRFAQVTVLDTTRIWAGKCRATPLWGEIRDFVDARENRGEWWSDITLLDGRGLTCMVGPINNGATIVRFVQPSAPRLPAQPPSRLPVRADAASG